MKSLNFIKVSIKVSILFQFYSRFQKFATIRARNFLVFFGYVLGTKLGCSAVLPLRMRHKAMQLVLGRLAGNKSEKSQFHQSFNQSFNFISIL